jgi:hypothetical protein
VIVCVKGCAGSCRVVNRDLNISLHTACAEPYMIPSRNNSPSIGYNVGPDRRRMHKSVCSEESKNDGRRYRCCNSGATLTAYAI